MEYLIIIPARGGSKGIPMKNIKPLDGKPLIGYTIEAAQGVTSDDNICLTTDDDAIIACAQQYGLKAPFKRPAELATDTASTYDVLLHALNYYEANGRSFDAVILLQPTSPFRTATHIKEAIALYRQDLDMVVSVKETASNPYYVLFEENKEGYLEKSKSGNFTRRQDCPTVWEYNGAVYVININSLKKSNLGAFTKVKKYPMDDLSSVDIDNNLDWLLAEAVISYRRDKDGK